MGMTSVEIEVGNPSDLDVTEKVEFFVDSGAFYSVVPTTVLEKLGIKPVAEEIFRLANGEKIKRKRGMAFFKYEGKIGSADVIFGEKDDYTLLGVMTLEALGLALDPLKRELKTIPMLLA